jgi:hypothetical protein
MPAAVNDANVCVFFAIPHKGQVRTADFPPLLLGAAAVATMEHESVASEALSPPGA